MPFCKFRWKEHIPWIKEVHKRYNCLDNRNNASIISYPISWSVKFELLVTYRFRITPTLIVKCGSCVLRVKCFTCLGRSVLAWVFREHMPLLLSSGWSCYLDTSFSMDRIMVLTCPAHGCMHSKTNLLLFFLIFFILYIFFFLKKYFEKFVHDCHKPTQ